MTSTSNDKLLDVFELIVTQKAVSPNEIQKQTGLSRTAVHRALKSLESRNIARARLGNRQYTLTSEFAQKVASNETIPTKLETMIPQIAAFCKGHKLHCDFFELADKDLVRLIESTDANPDHFVDELLDSQSLLLAVCSNLPEEQISRILKQRFRELDKYTLHNTRNWILSQLSKKKDKIFEVADLNSILISLDNLDSNKGLLLNLRSRPHLSIEREKLRQAAVMIQAMSRVI